MEGLYYYLLIRCGWVVDGMQIRCRWYADQVQMESRAGSESRENDQAGAGGGTAAIDKCCKIN